MDLISLPLYGRSFSIKADRKAVRQIRAIRVSHLMLALGLFFALGMYRTFATAVVDGKSMEPTLHSGQRMLASAVAGSIRDGDIVVIRDWTGVGFLVKRVFRVGGEVVEFPYKPNYLSLKEAGQIFQVPEGQVYVLGDNRATSVDSRTFGPVALDRVIGKVIYY